MLCVPLGNIGAEEVRAALAEQDCVELRLDLLALSEGEIRDLVAGARAKVIATCRPCERGEEGRTDAMLAAIGAGAAWADVELEADAPYREAVTKAARAAGCKLIVSVHDWENTPTREELLYLVDKCYELGADIAKISCMARSPRDAARVLALYDSARPLVAFCMGEEGRITRLASLVLGAPFTFAALGEGRGTAPGQIEQGAMRRLLKELGYGGRQA